MQVSYHKQVNSQYLSKRGSYFGLVEIIASASDGMSFKWQLQIFISQMGERRDKEEN